MFSQHQTGKSPCGYISVFRGWGFLSDVKVVSPYAEIPWTNLSRFDDDEMKKLMIDVVKDCYNLLLLLFNDPTGNDIVELLRTTDVKKDWRDPAGTLAA
jgi:hypothetical protein